MSRSYSDQNFAEVDRCMDSYLLPHDAVLEAALAANRDAGFYEIDVAPNQGKLLNLLIRIAGARKVLEIGALGGYSTIWMARALPKNGKVTTLEIDETCAKVTADNLARAGVRDIVDIRHAPALETLPKLHQEGAGPYDFIFIDADKRNNPKYLEWVLRLSRVGTVIIFDNVVRFGQILDKKSKDPGTIGTLETFAMIRDGKQLDATALQTVGTKGWDGFALGLVTEASS